MKGVLRVLEASTGYMEYRNIQIEQDEENLMLLLKVKRTKSDMCSGPRPE